MDMGEVVGARCCNATVLLATSCGGLANLLNNTMYTDPISAQMVMMGFASCRGERAPSVFASADVVRTAAALGAARLAPVLRASLRMLAAVYCICVAFVCAWARRAGEARRWRVVAHPLQNIAEHEHHGPIGVPGA
jgi:hypothetical protein